MDNFNKGGWTRILELFTVVLSAVYDFKLQQLHTMQMLNVEYKTWPGVFAYFKVFQERFSL